MKQNTTVYILMSWHFDLCDFWETIEDVYADELDAITAQAELERSNTNIEQQSWHIVARPLR